MLVVHRFGFRIMLNEIRIPNNPWPGDGDLTESKNMKRDDFLQMIEGDEAVIFDFGGIFIDIDYDLTIQGLSALSPAKDVAGLYTKKKQAEFFLEFEVGKLSGSEFLSTLKEELAIKAKDEKIVKAWNSMLRDIKIARVHFLKELVKQKRVFLLSNINQIHEDYLEHYILDRPEYHGFYDLFEKVYFSHKIGMRKPNKEIFEMVIAENKLNPQKTLFMDDSYQHIEGARAVRLKTYFLDPPNSFIVEPDNIY